MTEADVQKFLTQAQSYQQQMQLMTGQKEALNMQILETNKALEELSKPDKEDVYKITGPILVKVSREDAKKDLKSKKEVAMLRLKTVEKSEAGIKQKLEELKQKLEKSGV